MNELHSNSQRTVASIPSFDAFIEPLLRVLYESHDGLKTSDAYKKTADMAGISLEAREQLLPSGQQEVYKNRIGWAQDRLKRYGLSHSPSWGTWQLTPEGRSFVQSHSGGIDRQLLDRIARPQRYENSLDDVNNRDIDDEVVASISTPQERIDSAVRELNDSISQQLLDLIFSQTDRFFETLVLDVLREMGYGAGPRAIKHQGGVQDAGIDGIISLDPLGLEKVYVQAKRWTNTVGRPEIQGFSGALRGQNASKGVFITTSCFSSHAKEFANSVSDSIILIDGERLTKLMIEYGVGVQTSRTVKVVELDRDYFEGE